jgi:nicotinamide-nucleotide amidase
MNKIFASIITIGDELLIGQTIDTNSAWMGQELNKTGIWLRRRVAVGDVWEEIWRALDEESQQASVVLITGGLGPTADDITKPLLCQYFGGTLVVNDAALENVKNIFTKYLNRPLLERNLKQAEVPDVCTVIQNKRGTAPGMWFEKNGVIFISMPGVPYEMKGMMTDYVLPQLQTQFALPAVQHRTLVTFGLGESFIAERIQEWESALPPHIKLAYLPNYGMVRLRLTGAGSDVAALAAELDSLFAQLKTWVADVIVTDADEEMETVLGRLLQSRGKTMSTAESCTGGYIAHRITTLPGSSAWYRGSVVSYANGVKTGLLGVKPETLEADGAVSEATVQQMVRGVLQATGTDYAVAVSGIMGPDGGSEAKPVGTVWMAAGNAATIITQKINLRFDRRKNIEITTMQALNFLRRFVVEEESR